MNHQSRRNVLKLGTASLTAALAGCSDEISSNSQAPSTATRTPSADTPNTDLRARISELETQVESLRSKLEEKNDRIEELENESGEYQYSEATREKATSVGKQLREAVVNLEFELGGGYRSGGTGWFIDDHHIITNRHVVSDLADGRTESETGYLLDGTTFDFSLKNRTDDSREDIALLETEQTAPFVPPLGSSSSLSSGQPIVQVGNPNMVGFWVISLGEFVKEARFGNGLHSEIPSTQGNSGSPVATLDGKVIGLTYGSVSRENSTGPPEPAEPTALEEYPYQKVQYAEHEKIETVEDYYNQWTS